MTIVSKSSFSSQIRQLDDHSVIQDSLDVVYLPNSCSNKDESLQNRIDKNSAVVIFGDYRLFENEYQTSRTLIITLIMGFLSFIGEQSFGSDFLNPKRTVNFHLFYREFLRSIYAKHWPQFLQQGSTLPSLQTRHLRYHSE